MKKYIVTIVLLLTSFGFSFAQTLTDNVQDNTDCANITHNLKLGSRDSNTGGDVSTLQIYLSQANFLDSDPTGYFGKMTRTAVQNFQSANGISNTGNVGPLTRAKIQEMSCGGVAPTKPPVLPTILCPLGFHSSYNTNNYCEPDSTTPTPVNSANQFSSNDKVMGWYWGDINQKKTGTPDNWLLKDSGTRSAMWYAPTTAGDPLNTLYVCNGVVSHDSAPCAEQQSTKQTDNNIVSEQVTCSFKSQTEQKCWGDAPSIAVGSPVTHYSCSGVGTCVVNVKGKNGTPISWGSSCGGSVNTTIDGNNEYASFGGCSTTTQVDPVNTTLPVINLFIASKNQINAGEEVKLKWSSSNSSYCNIIDSSRNILTSSYSISGTDGSGGNFSVYPKETTKYLLSCTNKIYGTSDGKWIDINVVNTSPTVLPVRVCNSNETLINGVCKSACPDCNLPTQICPSGEIVPMNMVCYTLPTTNTSPYISSISPNSVRTGTMLTINGSGFASTGNILYMDGYSVTASSLWSIKNTTNPMVPSGSMYTQDPTFSSDGSSIVLTFPSAMWSIGGPVACGGIGCGSLPPQEITQGVHTFTVKNNKGVSNTVSFTVVTP